jgi:predicted ATP-dependent endonuclease of OLD family
VQYPFEVEIRNFRSIKDSAFVPLRSKTTFVVGQNNSGKSNILRALAAVFNRSPDVGDSDYRYHLHLKDNEHLNRIIPEQCRRAFGTSKIQLILAKDRSSVPQDVPNAIHQYAQTGHFLSDFGRSSSDVNENISSIYNKILQDLMSYMRGTVYVPTTRFITQVGQEPFKFSNFEMPGETLSYGNIVQRLAQMDRPPTAMRSLREQFKQLEDFLAFCLEKSSVKLEIPTDQKTIHISIEGIEYPLEDLGTGIEQLIILGLASFGFENKLVLIDEPELHFHPRAQKRMIKYLHDNVEATFVFATHSAAILDSIGADVVQVSYENGQSSARTLVNNSDRYRAVRDLGHSPSELLQTRFAIWVEGPSDRIYVNHWIKQIDNSLVEGVDYAILFYGGKILSHHGFLDEDSELVKAISLARAFAVIMDSDIKSGKPEINATKTRVRDEVQSQGGLCWITKGREIENYLPKSVIGQLASKFPGATEPSSELEQVLNPERVKKSDFARAAIGVETDEWPLDLKDRVIDLVKAIQEAR